MKVNNKEEFDKQNIFGKGEANTAFADYFIGNSFLNPLTHPGECAVFLANVTFEPGCRNNWHIHHAKSGGGQMLICTAGSGWYQEEGREPVSLEPGMVIMIQPEVKHWRFRVLIRAMNGWKRSVMNSMTVSVNNRLYKSMAGGCKNGSKTDSRQNAAWGVCSKVCGIK